MQRIQQGICHLFLCNSGSSSSGELTASLNKAVRHGDVERMRELLKQGADPERVEPGNTGVSAQADELLLAARKINRLLPRGTRRGSSTRFEKALRNYDLPRVREVFAQALARYPATATPADAATSLWKNAANAGAAAVLDAMLVLGGDKLERYWSGQCGQDGKTILDALLTQKDLNSVLHYPLTTGAARHGALRDYLKQFPYYSARPGRQDLAHLNGEVAFKDNEQQKIKCRHLAFAWLTKVRDKDGKPVYDNLKDAKLIRKHISVGIEAEYKALVATAPEVHLVVNKDWGRFAADRFREIEAGMERGEPPVKRMLVESGNHAMAVEFKVKQKAGRKLYVQNFYDPNLTNVHKRLRTDGVHGHEEPSLDRLLHNASHYHAYYGDSETVSIAYAVPDAGTAAAAGKPGRCLSSSLDEIDLNASVLFHLLSGGFDGELDKIANRLLDTARRHPDQAVALLSARNKNEDPGFHWTLQEGHAHAVKRFAGIVLQSGLEEGQQVELLAAKGEDGVPGFFLALKNNRADAVQAFAESVLQSPLGDDQQVDLLAARNPDGFPGLYLALGKNNADANNADAVRAFVESVLQSPLGHDQQVELLAARHSGGVPGLYLALHDNNADGVRAFAESVLQSLLGHDQQVELLAARDSDGFPGLCLALDKNNAAAVRAFAESVLQSPLGHDQQVELLAARGSDGFPGLYCALENNHAKGVEAFAESVLQSLLGHDQQVELLAARDPDGFPGLYLALHENKVDAVRAFVENVCRSPLGDEQKIELLAAKEGGGTPGILAAEPEGRPNSAAAAYREAIQQGLTVEQQALLEAEISGNRLKSRPARRV